MLGITPVQRGGAFSLVETVSFLLKKDVPGGNSAPGCLQRSLVAKRWRALFDEEGTFLEEEFMEEVHKFVNDYQSAQKKSSERTEYLPGRPAERTVSHWKTALES